MLVVVVVTRIVIVIVVVGGRVMVLVVKGMEVTLRGCTIDTIGSGMGGCRVTGSCVVYVIVAGVTSSTVRASGLVIVTSGSTVMMPEI